MSPMPAEGLQPTATPDNIQKSISDSIAQCMREGGRSQEQCIAIAYEMARKATGREIGRKSTRLK